MDTVSLVKKLVSIPSHVSNDSNEGAIAEFVFAYLKNIPFLKVYKQYISKGRFNVIAETDGKKKLFVAGHLDTVKPQHTRKVKDEKGTLVGNKLYGLGALDTKGGVGALLNAIKEAKRWRGLTALFYCDEEFDFMGIKKYISSENKKIGDLAVFAEPTDLNIWNAHRGLVEFSLSVRGRSGHMANPYSGVNAIAKTFAVLMKLQQFIRKFKDGMLGVPALSISSVNGGVCHSINKEGNVVVEDGGNVIPDHATFSVDVRTTHTDLNAMFIKKFLKVALVREGCQLINFKVRNDVSPMSTNRDSLVLIEQIQKAVLGKISYLNPRCKGYGDGQLIQEKYKIPVIYFGPAGANPHGTDEYVIVSSLQKLEKIYDQIIGHFCT